MKFMVTVFKFKGQYFYRIRTDSQKFIEEGFMGEEFVFKVEKEENPNNEGDSENILPEVLEEARREASRRGIQINFT